MTDWATISALATAGGTLVLAIATFGSVRSANRAARAAERSLLAGLRPLLIPSRLQDPAEKVGFMDEHWVKVAGGHGLAEARDEAIYLAIAVRNAGTGMAVLHGWFFHSDRLVAVDEHPEAGAFHRLTRDLYVPAGDGGFWQGAFRDPADPQFAQARHAINAKRAITIDLLYGDYEGGQRMISRFTLTPLEDGSWLAAAARHWNLDRPNPR
ncbi:MAG: hypothetical protein ABI775_12585 [Pseudonocardiales bacterium]